MIHLFYLYSGIVARMVPHIIDHLQLPTEDILIVTDRSQSAASLPARLRTCHANFLPFRNRWKTLPSDWNAITRNSRRIDEITGHRPYTAYLPSPSDFPGQQLLWHPHCQRYWLIEEGLGSYCPPGASPVHEKPFTPFQKLQFGLRLRSLARIRPSFTDYPHWSAKYAGAFSSNANAFPGFPSPVVNLDQPLYRPVASPITRLVIFDDFSVFHAGLQKIYLDVIREVISTEHRPGDHWAYKLHPRCAACPGLIDDAKRLFDEALPADTPHEALAPDTCAEDLGISPSVTTYGYMSSCLFYIHQCGGRVASFKHLIEQREPAFHVFWKRFFPPVLEPLVGAYRMIEIPR